MRGESKEFFTAYTKVMTSDPETKPLFPKLEALRITLAARSFARTLKLLEGAPLSELYSVLMHPGEACQEDAVLDALLATLPWCTQTISKLVLSNRQEVADTEEEPATVTRFTGLQTLMVPRLFDAEWATVATLPELKSLSVLGSSWQLSRSVATTGPCFRRVTDLHIYATPSALRTVLRMAPRWNLRNLVIMIQTKRASEMDDICVVVSHHIRPLALHSLTVGAGGFEDSARLTFEGLRPLLGFRSLRHLSLTLRHSISSGGPQRCLRLSDEQLHLLAQSFPGIIQLQLGNVGCSLQGMAVFAESCPRLEQLAVHVDVSETPLQESEYKGLKVGTSMKNLFMDVEPRGAQIDGDVTSFLEYMFPFARIEFV